LKNKIICALDSVEDIENFYLRYVEDVEKKEIEALVKDEAEFLNYDRYYYAIKYNEKEKKLNFILVKTYKNIKGKIPKLFLLQDGKYYKEKDEVYLNFYVEDGFIKKVEISESKLEGYKDIDEIDERDLKKAKKEYEFKSSIDKERQNYFLYGSLLLVSALVLFFINYNLAKKQIKIDMTKEIKKVEKKEVKFNVESKRGKELSQKLKSLINMYKLEKAKVYHIIYNGKNFEVKYEKDGKVFVEEIK